MERIIIRYKIKPAQLDRHLRLLRAVYDELHELQPAGFRFATYSFDQRTFLDIAIAPQLPGALSDLDTFREYRADLEDRCQERIVIDDVEQVGSYGFGESRAN
jgi:hypothetical protein